MALSYAQLDAITHNKILAVLPNNVYNKHQLLARWSQPGKMRLEDGGVQIQVPLVSSQTGAGGYYSDFETLDITPTDNISAAVYAWKQAYEPIHIARSDILKNTSDNGKLKLIASKAKVAEMGLRETLTLGIYSGGDASTGALSTKQITGLQATLSTSSTYGGIAVADMADWVAQVSANGGTNRALTLGLMQKVYQDSSDGAEQPSVLLMKGNVYNQLWSLYQPHQRLMADKEMAKLGFENVPVFNGKPIIIDEGMTANSIYFLNEDFLYLVVHKDENMRREQVSSLEKQNSLLTKIFWMGNLVCSQRRRQGLLDDITATS